MPTTTRGSVNDASMPGETMVSVLEVRESLLLIHRLLEDVSEQLSPTSRANRRSASLKLQRIAAIASTLAATIHSPRH